MKQFLTILFSLLSLSLSAQILEPVHWSLTDTRQTDSVLTVTLTARIDKGWHLYSTSLPEDGPRPTSFSVEGADSLSVALVKGSLQTAYDENFLMDLSAILTPYFLACFLAPLAFPHGAPWRTACCLHSMCVANHSYDRLLLYEAQSGR